MYYSNYWFVKKSRIRWFFKNLGTQGTSMNLHGHQVTSEDHATIESLILIRNVVITTTKWSLFFSCRCYRGSKRSISFEERDLQAKWMNQRRRRHTAAVDTHKPKTTTLESRATFSTQTQVSENETNKSSSFLWNSSSSRRPLILLISDRLAPRRLNS